METRAVPRLPWHPLTFNSVAGLAQAPLHRWWLMPLLTALLAAAAIVWFLVVAWRPVFQEAIDQLPAQSEIARGRLEWDSPSPMVLGKNAFVAIMVNLDDLGPQGQLADIQLELGRQRLKVRSLFGFLSLSYVPDYTVLLNRTQMEPWWGAWEPFIWVALGSLTMGVCLLLWLGCAVVYACPLRLMTFFLDRAGGWSGCWRLALGAQLTGALWATVAILLYGLRQLDLIGFLLVFGLHPIVTWIFLALAPLYLPRLSSAPRRSRNPFQVPAEKTK